MASLFELISDDNATPKAHDEIWVRFIKIGSIFLMSMSFLLSIVVVFAATETSTQMLGKGSHEMHPKYRKQRPYSPLADSPIALLVREYEMEYIIVRAGFFQSLGSWYCYCHCKI